MTLKAFSKKKYVDWKKYVVHGINTKTVGHLYLYLLDKAFIMFKIQYRWSKELLFQLVLIFIVFLFYSFDKNDPLIEEHEIVFFSTYVTAAMIVNYILLDRFLYKKKYIGFFFWFFVLISIVIVIEEGVLEKIYYPDTRGKYIPNIFFNLLDVLPPIIILSGFKFAWDAVIKQKELDEVKLKAQESELQLLKTQINPHFLFNNLNNLYAHAVEKSGKTPEIILALSDFLRYTLYECKARYVSINKEIEQLENYIQLHEMHLEGRGKVSFTSDIDGPGFQIAPLLLMVFIENAFKHSTSSQSDSIEIDIDLRVNNNGQLTFACSNTFQEQSNTESLSKGIGLKNVKKRLNLLYPKQHELIINSEKELFKVNLEIQLNQLQVD